MQLKNFLQKGSVGLLLCAATFAHAQWQMQRSGTTASFRGVHAVDGDIAWASGSNGTVLRTEDGGQHWQACAVPADAAKLDFRSVWAWDAQHAMAMSSGTGSQSRLYSTHDGCRTWRLIFTNPDADGFWDGLQFDGIRFGAILGDPVRGSFTLLVTYDGGNHWTRQMDPCLQIKEPQQGAFAASNESMVVLPIRDASTQMGPAIGHQIWFGTSGGWLYGLQLATLQLIDTEHAPNAGCTHVQALPERHSASAGIFAIALNDGHGVAVGGDYSKPQDGAASAAYASAAEDWRPALHPPSGFRSAVAWNANDASWLAAGPSGSDTSHDGGKTWQPLDQGKWNAVSLPFAVGPDGRIGRLVSWGQLRVSNRAPGQQQPAQ